MASEADDAAGPRHAPLGPAAARSRAGTTRSSRARSSSHRLPYLEPNEDFREKFQYQNLMFLTAGHLAREVAGMPWEEVIRTRILDPDRDEEQQLCGQRVAESDATSPRPTRSRTRRPSTFRSGSSTRSGRPARSTPASTTWRSGCSCIWAAARSTANASWRRGRSRTCTGRRWSFRPSPGSPTIRRSSSRRTGLGWFIESYRGKKRVHHGGNIDGFSAQVSLLPADGIGVVVLTNLDGTPLPDILAAPCHRIACSVSIRSTGTDAP